MILLPLSIFNIDLTTGNIILLTSLLMFVAILLAKVGIKYGVPAMLLFLLIGMLAGEDGIGIRIDNLHVTEFLGHLAMTIILLSGGLETSLDETRPIIRKGISMSTLGVFLTIVITGTFIWFVLGEKIGGAGKTLMGDVVPAVDYEKLCRGLGIEHVYTVNAFDVEALTARVKEEVKADHLSVIISKAPCALIPEARSTKKCEALPEACRHCGACLIPGCPALTKNADGSVTIDDTMCNGCGLCRQLCRFDAIREVNAR